MAEDDFIIEQSKVSVVLQQKERILHLFGVSVTLQNYDLVDDHELSPFSPSVNNDGQVVSLENNTESVRLSFDGPQENVKEAKTYIKSLIGGGKEFKKLIKLQVNQFNMIIQEQDFIQKTSKVVLDFLNESCQVCVLGQEENVNIAQSLIERMVQEQLNKSVSEKAESSKHSDHISSTKVKLTSSDYILQNENDQHTFKENSTGLVPNPCEEYSLQTDCDLESNSQTLFISDSMLSKRGCGRSPCRSPVHTELMPTCKELIEAQIEPSLSELKISSHNCDTATSDSSESHTELDYSSKVEFALKLGYTEDQLLTVLKKIGTDAGQNAILSELIKIGTSFKPIDSSDPYADDLTLDNGTFLSAEELDNADHRLESPLDRSFDDIADEKPQNNLRPIVIDGSNLAMSHGNKEIFSCHGIKLAVDWFKQRGHTEITVFVPQWRKETSRPDSKIKDQEILCQLEKEKVLVFTPARRIGGKRVVCYDDRYVLKLAAENGGIVVSNDNYRDLLNESPEYRKVVEERLLMYSFVNDRFMPPDDPLGRHGPSLDNFLCKEPKVPEPLPPLCPYGSKKCTYGNKCKYYHPERGNLPHKSVSEKLAENARQKLQEVRERKSVEGDRKKLELRRTGSKKMALQRTQSLIPVGSTSDFAVDNSHNLNRHSGDFGTLCLDNKELLDLEKQQNPEKLQKWKNYDDKLTEYRKKVELADQEEKQRQEEKKKEERVSSPAQSGLFDPLPLPNQGDQIRSRSSSPSQRGSPSPQLKTQEQFLSGHLLLAKKLSDEANDTKVRHRGLDEREFVESPLVGPPQQKAIHQEALPMHRPLQHSQSHQQQHSQEFLPIHRPLQQSHSHQQPPIQQPRHQKLSRQYSLQGSHDPRLRPEFQQQISHDPYLMSQQHHQQHQFDQQQQFNKPALHRAKTLQGNRHTELKRQEPFVAQGVKFSIGEPRIRHFTPDMNRYHDNSGQDSVFYSGDENYTSEHASLARMQSAPEANKFRNQNAHKGVGRMVRQNSSSDTQLHMIGNELDASCFSYGQYPVNMPSDIQRNEHLPHYNMPGMSVYDAQQQQQQQHLRTMSMGPQYSYRSHNPPHREPVGVSWSFGDPNTAKPSYHIGGSSNSTNNQYVNPSTYIQTCEHMPLQATKSDFSDQLFNQRTQDMWQNQHSIQGTTTAQTFTGSKQTFATGVSGVLPSSTYHQQFADDSPIHPSDKRYNLYYHLCGLFPEVKVREVMNRYPDETNPQELCAYIIGAK